MSVASAVCQASGDPHYTTWDGGHFDYQGICLHLLAGQCGKKMPDGLEPWSVKYVYNISSTSFSLYLFLCTYLYLFLEFLPSILFSFCTYTIFLQSQQYSSWRLFRSCVFYWIRSRWSLWIPYRITHEHASHRKYNITLQYVTIIYCQMNIHNVLCCLLNSFRCIAIIWRYPR